MTPVAAVRDSLTAALAAAFTASGWEEAVRTAIGRGGDTDTLACIAGAVAEAMHGLPAPIEARARALLTPDLVAVLDRLRSALKATAS